MTNSIEKNNGIFCLFEKLFVTLCRNSNNKDMIVLEEEDIVSGKITTIGEDLPIIQGVMASIAHLKNNLSIARYEWGASMSPILESGQFCKIEPINNRELKIGDAVFCKTEFSAGTHMIVMISCADPQKRLYAIGTSGLTIIDWVERKSIYGISTALPYKVI